MGEREKGQEPTRNPYRRVETPEQIAFRQAKAEATKARYAGPLARARRIYMSFKLHALGHPDEEIAETLGISERQVRLDRKTFVKDASGKDADVEYRLEARGALDEAVRVAHVLATEPGADSRDARALAYAARQKALAAGEIPVSTNSTIISANRVSMIPPGATDEDLEAAIAEADRCLGGEGEDGADSSGEDSPSGA